MKFEDNCLVQFVDLSTETVFHDFVTQYKYDETYLKAMSGAIGRYTFITENKFNKNPP